MGRFIVFVMLLLLFGCASPEPAAEKAYPLENTEWLPVSIYEQGNLALSADTEVKIVFKDKKVNGCSGDNYFFGSYQNSLGTSLKFGPLGVTRRMGPNAEYEQKFLKMLDLTRNCRIEGDTLILLDDNGAEIGRFKAKATEACPRS